MKIDQAQRLRELEQENNRLKRLMADLSMDNTSIKEALRKKITSPIRVGANLVIGAGSVVIKDVPAGSVVAGVPARIIKDGNK